MKNNEFFYKRFSVGLTLDASLSDFESFLLKYSKYISNFYFSLPLGDKFHARENVVKQMRNSSKVSLFWEMLKMIKLYGINLELVLNNGNITEDDIIASKNLLNNYGVVIDLLGITDDIYFNVKKHFPNQKIVYSFKNHSNIKKDFENVKGHYDEIVLGRQNIRNYELFEYIKTQLNSKVVLLINNGCSHICGGCTTIENCHSSYYRSKLNYSPEFLYALQSVMPYEIHEDLLDLSNVYLLKISSRNASLQYLSDCMNSYINCIEDSYIEKSCKNYILWGRLAWHVEYYDTFSLERIKKYKASIYNKEPIPITNNKISLCLDFRDKYLFEDSKFIHDKEYVKFVIDKASKGLPYSLNECIIGVSNCRKLFANISINNLRLLFNELKLKFKNVIFEIPSLLLEDYIKLDIILKCVSDYEVDCIVVNDWNTAQYILDNYSLSIAIGEKLSSSNIYSPSNNYDCDNNEQFGINLVSKKLRQKISKMSNVKFVICDMKPEGICISNKEELSLYINLQYHNIAYDTCNCKEKSTCTMPCMQIKESIFKHIYTDKHWGLYFNSIREYISDYRPIVKTVFENRATFIIKV